MTNSSQKGFIRATLLVVGALVILKYAYDIDVVGFLTTGNFRNWLDKFYNLGQMGWEKHREVVMSVWSYVWVFIKSALSKIFN